MVAEVLDHAASQGHNSCGVAIAFNGGTLLPWRGIHSVGKATSAFWGRVAYSLYLAIVPEPTLFYGSFETMPFFSSIDCDVVHSLARKLELGRVVIAADDMWKLTRVMKASLSERDQQEAMRSITAMYKHGWSLVCSGFTMSDAMDLATMSGRKTKHHFLCTTSQETHNDYAPMLSYLKKAYSGSAFIPTLRGLYEIVKNVPGYLGMWIEMKESNYGSTYVRSVATLETPFVSVLTKELITNPQLFTGYWRAIVNSQDDVKESEVLPHDVFTALEDARALLPRARRVAAQAKQVDMDGVVDGGQNEGSDEQTAEEVERYYLSPLAITHPWLRGAREHSLIATAVELLEAEGPWTAIEKGKALEAMLVVRLALTAAYVNDAKARMINPAREVSVGTLIKRLCGKAHVHVGAHKDDQKVDEGLPAAFPDYSDASGFSLANVSWSEVHRGCNPVTGKAIVKELSAFPAVWSETNAGSVQGPFAAAEKQALRLAENIAALNSPHFAVLSPQCPMNA
ncbi:Hypothetical protein, putative, partial [Bodo saltans]